MKLKCEILFSTPKAIRCRQGSRVFWLPKQWGGLTLKVERPAPLPPCYAPGPAVISVPKSLAERAGLVKERCNG